MNWARPELLLLLLCAPMLGGLLVWSARRRQTLLARFAHLRLLADLTAGLSPARVAVRAGLLLCGVLLLALALAGPRWGHAYRQARQSMLDIVIAIDTSHSMLAPDLKPDRLTRARIAALELMKLGGNDRFALLPFAGSAFLQCPLTFDDAVFRQNLEMVEPGLIPHPGTSLAVAIRAAMTAFVDEPERHKVLVLFTDGEDHEGEALEAAREAADKGLRIFAIGVGTPVGELVPSRSCGNCQHENPPANKRCAECGALLPVGDGFLRGPDGQVVRSRLNEPFLRELAEATRGFYLRLGTRTMEVLHKNGLAPLPKSEDTAAMIRRERERYQWPLAAAILLLAVEVLLSPRRRRTAAMAVVLLAGLGTIHALDARQEYNAGTRALMKEDFNNAATRLEAALTAHDLGVQQRAYYNLGNTFYRLGQRAPAAAQKIVLWEKALKHLEGAAHLDPKDGDAQFNRNFVKRKLEELKRQQPRPPPPQQQKQDNKQPGKSPQPQPNQKKSQGGKSPDPKKNERPDGGKATDPMMGSGDETDEHELPEDLEKMKSEAWARRQLDTQKLDEGPLRPAQGEPRRNRKNW